MVHWHRNILKDVPDQKIRAVAAMLKAIHAHENRKTALEKRAEGRVPSDCPAK